MDRDSMLSKLSCNHANLTCNSGKQHDLFRPMPSGIIEYGWTCCGCGDYTSTGDNCDCNHARCNKCTTDTLERFDSDGRRLRECLSFGYWEVPGPQESVWFCCNCSDGPNLENVTEYCVNCAHRLCRYCQRA